jgi:hypothetical protein
MATTAKEQLAAKVEAMTEDEAADVLRTLNDPDELTEEQRQGILEAMAAMDRGEGIPHDEVMQRLRARFTGERKRASGE